MSALCKHPKGVSMKRIADDLIARFD